MFGEIEDLAEMPARSTISGAALRDGTFLSRSAGGDDDDEEVGDVGESGG